MIDGASELIGIFARKLDAKIDKLDRPASSLARTRLYCEREAFAYALPSSL